MDVFTAFGVGTLTSAAMLAVLAVITRDPRSGNLSLRAAGFAKP